MMNEPRSEQGRRRRTAAKTMSPSRSYCKQAREKERNRKQCSSHSSNVAREEVGESGSCLVARGEILSSRSEYEKFWQRCRQLRECAIRRHQQDTKVYERESKSSRDQAAHNEESHTKQYDSHDRSIARRSSYTSSSSSSLCSDTNHAPHSRLDECEGRKTFTTQQPQINQRTTNSLKTSERQQFHDCSFTTGENSRCNCSGRRRATLAGLIELFEQKVQVNESDNNRGGGLELGEKRSESIGKEKSRKNFLSGQFNKLNKQPEDHDRMRDIITPIKYETSDNDHDDNETDEDRFHVNYAAHSSTDAPGRANKVHRMAAKGVPILPRPQQPDLRRLTATHWQPATDGRQYEQRLRPQRRPKRSQTHHHNDNEEGAKQETFEAQPENRSRLESSANYDREEESELAQQDEESQGEELERPICQAKASLAATRCPSIVKHQASSSRRLLNQLARLRRLNEPSYRVRRPEKVSQVEELIEQLEKATEEWENDELLLERAERRDWPAEYYERFQKNIPKGEEVEDFKRGRENKKKFTTLSADTPEEASILQGLDYGCRADVGPFEEETIAKSHSHLSLMAADGPLDEPEPVAGLSRPNNEPPRCASWTLGSDWGSRRGARRRSPRAFADRYHDDLAVRRLGHARATSSPGASPSERGQVIMMSYLLCSNAYTPTMSEANYKPTPAGQRSALGGLAARGDWAALERQLSEDDLHYRNYLKAKPEPFEPPFGIPRQLASATSHSTASHYLRRRESGENHENSSRQGSASGQQSSLASDAYCCSCGPQKVSPTQVNNSNKQQHQAGGKAPRSDSRVSFREQVTTVTSGGSTTGWTTTGGCGRASSADSGLARESPAGRQSRSQLVTPNSPFGASSSSGRMNTTRPISAQNSANLSARATPNEPTGEWSSDGDAQLEDHEDLEAELDLDAELAFESPVQLACESPQPERLKASLVATPARQRPKINIENPRSKSPLVRVSNSSRHLEAQRLNRQRNCKQSEENNIVQIRCYGDVSNSKSSDSMSETECRFDFVDDDNEDDGDEVADLSSSGNNRPQQAAVARSLAVPVINYETCPDTKSSTKARDELLYKTHSSSKQLQPPAECFGSNRQVGTKSSADEGHPTMPKTVSLGATKAENQTSKGLKFSIGEYKPLDKPSLKIL